MSSTIPDVYDTLGASIVDGFRGKASGKLLVFDPKTGVTTVIIEDVWFANGVAIDEDETFILLCETFTARVLKYDIISKTTTIFAEGVFPGKSPRRKCFLPVLFIWSF